MTGRRSVFRTSPTPPPSNVLVPVKREESLPPATPSPRFNSLMIRRFRGLKDVKLENLGRFNVLVGRNDVGKTSVLEAVFLLSGLTVRLPVAIQNLRQHQVAKAGDLSLLFHRLDAGATIEIAGDTLIDTRTLTIAAHHDVVVDRPPQLPGVLGQERGESTGRRSGSSRERGNDGTRPANGISSSLSFDRPCGLRCDAVLRRDSDNQTQTFSGILTVRDGNLGVDERSNADGFHDHIVRARFLVPSASYESKLIGDVMVKKKHDTLVECLRIMNPEIRTVAVSGDTVFADVGLNEMIPLNMFGSGLVRAAFILSLCIVGHEQILLIDEIGHGLHHSVMESFLSAIMKMSQIHDMQVFATTHSRELLASLDGLLSKDDFASFRDDASIYALARSTRHDNDIMVYPYDHEQLSHALSNSIEVR